MAETRQYLRWNETAIHCHTTGQDCGTCPLRGVNTERFKYDAEKNKVKNCKMPEAVQILIEKEIPIPLNKVFNGADPKRTTACNYKGKYEYPLQGVYKPPKHNRYYYE